MKYASLLILLLLIACSTSQKDEAYLKTLNQWKVDRLSSLKEPLGYMSLVGLQWIKEGSNTVGSTAESDIRLPKQLPATIGQIIRQADDIRFEISHPEVLTNRVHQETVQLIPDSESNFPMMNWKSYYWYLIKRGDRYGIRVKDTLADMRINLNEIPSYEPSMDWIIEAEYIAPKMEEKQTFKNHVNVTYENDVKGRLRFDYKGESYEFVATDGGSNQLFIVFGDDTNGESTYGGGRFLYVDVPQEGQKAILDFNKSENPICSFNDFGTCPYPPAQNILDFPVTAGEQKVRE